MDSYDKLRAASNALARYFKLDQDGERAELDGRIGRSATRTSGRRPLDRQIKADRRT